MDYATARERLDLLEGQLPEQSPSDVANAFAWCREVALFMEQGRLEEATNAFTEATAAVDQAIAAYGEDEPAIPVLRQALDVSAELVQDAGGVAAVPTGADSGGVSPVPREPIRHVIDKGYKGPGAFNTISNVLVYLLVIASIVGLGLAVWIHIDNWNHTQQYRAALGDAQKKAGQPQPYGRDFQREGQQSVDQINRDRESLKSSQERYQRELAEYGDYVRRSEIELDLALNGNPDPQKRTEGLNQVAQRVADLFGQLSLLSGRIGEQRKLTQSAIDEQKQLREEILEPRVAGGKKLRDLKDDYRLASGAAEKEIHDLKPLLDNARAELAVVLKRNQQLHDRLAEIRKATAPRVTTAKP